MLIEQVQYILFIFAAGSTGGWILEVFYRHFFPSIGQTKRWVNPGFLAGPCNPLYGVGLSAIYGMSFITFPGLDPDGFLSKSLVILIMTIAMTLVELITGWIFIIRMNIRLWDYTDNRFNYRGIICPLYSFFWGLIGGGYYILLHEPMTEFLPRVVELRFFHIGIVVYYTVFIIDLLYSFKVLRMIRNFAREFHIIVRFNTFRSKLGELRAELKEKSRFFMPMQINTIPMRDALVRYKDAISVARWKERIQKMKDKAGDKKNNSEE